MATLLSKGMKNVSLTGSGEHLKDGNYLLAIETFKENNGNNGACVIVEMRVLSAEAVKDGVKPNPVGSTASVVWNTTKHPKMAFQNVVKFLLALFGIEQDEFDAPDATYYEDSVDDDGANIRGMQIEARTQTIINQGKENPANRGKEMTIPKFYHVEQTEADVEATRKMLDAPRTKGASSSASTKSEPNPASTTSNKRPAFLNRGK